MKQHIAKTKTRPRTCVGRNYHRMVGRCNLTDMSRTRGTRRRNCKSASAKHTKKTASSQGTFSYFQLGHLVRRRKKGMFRTPPRSDKGRILHASQDLLRRPRTCALCGHKWVAVSKHVEWAVAEREVHSFVGRRISHYDITKQRLGVILTQ